MSADLVIKGGTVIDGTGGPRVEGVDVAVSDGKIVEVGHGLDGRRVLDAEGHVIAPGFIDIHTHYDAQVFWDRALTPSCFHGVTTVVAGNCGFTIAPVRPGDNEPIVATLEKVEDMDRAALLEGVPWDFEDFPSYLASVGRGGTALNFGAYIGHTALRLYVLGSDYQRPAAPAEIEQMAALVAEAIDAGAMGFSTSDSPTHLGIAGEPVASRFSELDETTRLMEVVKDAGRGLIALVPGPRLLPSLLYELQPGLGVPITYGALLASRDGIHDYLVEVHRDGWAAGARVYPQVTPRPLTFTFSLAAPFPWNINRVVSELETADLRQRREAYADPSWRAQALDEWESNPGMFNPRWDTYELAESSNAAAVGCKVIDLAADRRVSPFDLILDLALDEPDLALRVRSVVANDDPDIVGALLTEAHTAIGLSDAGAHVGQLCDAPQATDLLARWVREREVLTLESAIHAMTGSQADLLGLPNRGRIAPGMAADLVVFNPDTVDPGPVRRVADLPLGGNRLTADEPAGVRHVIVNGTPIRVDGQQDLTLRPGQVVSPAPREVRR